MNYFSIDYLIVYAFLAITLFIGLWAGKGVKDIRDYAIANKSFGTGALVLTYLATNIAGASVINGAARVFSSGIIMTVALLALTIAFLFSAVFVVPKVAHFDDCLTMGDLMKKLYGPSSGIIAGILGLLKVVLIMGMELHVLGIICESLLYIPAKWGVIGGGIFLAIYTAHGGIRAVTVTDIFQFIMLAIFIPIIAYKAVGQVGGIKEVIEQTPKEKLEIFGHKDFSFYLTLFLMWLIPADMLEDPAIAQRLLMAKTGNQLRNQYFVVAAFDPAFRITIMLIGLAAFILYPNIEAKQVIPHLIHNLLPKGVQGLAIAGVLAVGMSTIDSYLHVAGLTLVHDVIQPICAKRNKLINEVRWSQWATVLISLVGIYIGLEAKDILGLAFSALEFVSPLLMFPLLSGVMGLKADKQAFYIALLITLIAFVIAKLTLPDDKAHLSALITMAVNGTSFFGIHFIRHRGFIIINRSEGKEALWRPRQKIFINKLKDILPTPKNIIAYSQAKVEQYGAPYILFGIFCIINYTVPFFLWAQVPPQYEDLMIYLRIIGGTLCVLLIVREKWPQVLLPYFPTFWHLTVLYCLPFTNTLMFLLTEFNTEWLMSILGITILLLVILDWATAIIIGSLGIVLGLIFYKVVAGPLMVPISFHAKYLITYQGLFGLLIGLIFARRKQLAYKQATTQRDYLKEACQNSNQEQVEIFKFRNEVLRELDAPQVEKVGQKKGKLAYISIDEVKDILYRVTDYMRLDVTKVDLTSFFEKVLEIPKMQDFPFPEGLQLQKYTPVADIQADENKLYKVFVNSITYLATHNTQDNPMRIILEDTQLGHTVSYMPGHTRKVAALKITITMANTTPPDDRDTYMLHLGQTSTWITDQEDELPLIENARIIDAHYGYLDVRNTHTHTYIIPVNVRDVRGKVMELLREPATTDPEELKHPLAIQLEKELMEKLKGTDVDMNIIQTALDLIKKYHGGVKRKSGEPFFTHPINVALILLEHSQEQDAIVGALLHDTIEDTSLTLAQIRKTFGEKVEFLVAKATNLEGDKHRVSLPDYENIIRIMNYEDPMAALVKLSDRLHNMRTIQHHSNLSKQKSIAKETLAHFVPLAHRLDLNKMADELERLSQEVMAKKERQ